MPFNPFSVIASKIYGAVAIAALTFAAVQTVRIEGLLFIHGFKQDLKNRDDTISAMQRASGQNHTDQVAASHAPAAISQTIAEKSDATAPAYYRSVHDAAAAHRVPARAACLGPASVPGADHPAPVADGPDSASEMVSRPRADDDLIVAAAGRAVKMQQDANELIARGAAVAEPPLSITGNTQ